MTKYIPNTITIFNLLSGCMGIVIAFNHPEKLEYAAYAIFIAAMFDFLDGMFARLLNAHSAMGKELDSLADMISFGLLPAVIIYKLFAGSPAVGPVSEFLNYSAFLITVFSAIRLAKFNNDPRQSENFIGLPTPANAILVASFPMILMQGNEFLISCVTNSYFLFFFCLGSSLLLVMELPLLSLKFKTLAFGDNIFRYILILSGLILFLIVKFAAIPLIIGLYILLSIIQFRPAGKQKEI